MSKRRTLAYLRALASHAGIDASGIEPPVEHHLAIEGLRLRCLDWGDPGAPPILLLHGGGQSCRTWDACCLLLVRRYRCLALDQRGHGDSDWSPAGEYSIEDHARDIAGVVDALALHQPLVVGMSMGGIHAIGYAIGHANRLRGMVCVDVGPDVQFEPVQRLMQGIGSYRRFSSPQTAAERMSTLGARRDSTLLKDTLSLNLRQTDDGAWTWKYDPRTLMDLSAEQVLAPRKPLWGQLSCITCPTLVVRGADSEIFAEHDAAMFAYHLPRAHRAIVPDARHSIQTDNPAGLAAAIEAFDTGLLQPVRQEATTPL